ncbi:uncharacterized protein LOC135095758 [Scylla paramamosain]|uniref:uncharacterized protein LOC135095758 n=1 Tax=Scylla paramamosain TaxID=85552 RepID=UPI003083ECCF
MWRQVWMQVWRWRRSSRQRGRVMSRWRRGGQAVMEASEDPVVINMPKCTYTSTITTTTSTTTQQHGLAGSLLGGILDHYSSPFILHATTQTQRWEDSLRQDLSSAALHSPLDPQLAEAGWRWWLTQIPGRCKWFPLIPTWWGAAAAAVGWWG